MERMSENAESVNLILSVDKDVLILNSDIWGEYSRVTMAYWTTALTKISIVQWWALKGDCSAEITTAENLERAALHLHR